MTQLPQDCLDQAEAVLLPFVNDHNEIVRWLRGQDPYEVAEALAHAIHQTRLSAVQECVRAIVDAYEDDKKANCDTLMKAAKAFEARMREGKGV